MPDFNNWSYAKLQEYLEGWGYAVNTNDSWGALVTAATSNWEVECH